MGQAWSEATILIEEPPEIEFRGQHVHFIDSCGIRRAMPRNVAIRTYALFAQRLREDRLGDAEIVQLDERRA